MFVYVCGVWIVVCFVVWVVLGGGVSICFPICLCALQLVLCLCCFGFVCLMVVCLVLIVFDCRLDCILGCLYCLLTKFDFGVV